MFSRVYDTMAGSVICSLILIIVCILQEAAGKYEGMVTIGAVGDFTFKYSNLSFLESKFLYFLVFLSCISD